MVINKVITCNFNSYDRRSFIWITSQDSYEYPVHINSTWKVIIVKCTKSKLCQWLINNELNIDKTLKSLFVFIIIYVLHINVLPMPIEKHKGPKSYCIYSIILNHKLSENTLLVIRFSWTWPANLLIMTILCFIMSCQVKNRDQSKPVQIKTWPTIACSRCNIMW